MVSYKEKFNNIGTKNARPYPLAGLELNQVQGFRISLGNISTTSLTREPLLKGKEQYSWPPLDQVQQPWKIYISTFTKQAILARR
jgi:hypothetical protein